MHDLRASTRQPGRSAIRQYRWRLLGMHRRYRGGNGMRRVARLRTQRIRGRTSAWLDRSIQALIRKLHYDRYGSITALGLGVCITNWLGHYASAYQFNGQGITNVETHAFEEIVREVNDDIPAPISSHAGFAILLSCPWPLPTLVTSWAMIRWCLWSTAVCML